MSVIEAKAVWKRTDCSISFFFSSRRRHTRLTCDWSSDVCSSDLEPVRAHDPDLLAAQPLAQGLQHADLIVDAVDALSAAGRVLKHDVPPLGADDALRSEERRVGKECRSRWSASQ